MTAGGSTDTTYEMWMDLVASVSSTLAAVPVDELLAAVGRAETVGPVLHPAAFRAADLAGQRRLLEAVRELRRVVVELRDREETHQ